MTLNIAIVDCIGLDYDGTTLQKKGIGGSESSIISISKELVNLGQSVTVFNNCTSTETAPGIYDGVVYRPISDLATNTEIFNVVISQRTVIPFTPKHLYDQVKQPAPRDYNPDWFTQFHKPNILKILWMQDTFIWGDTLLEPLVLDGYIDEIFNLSDWHIAYTTNCTHGPRRIYEVLKDRIFHTRNGINKWIDEVDIKAKDPNLFVYNASITKGMEPLVTKIWPKLKQHLPDAKLKIVGGYYDFKNEPDTPYKKQWQSLYESAKTEPSIEFTGIIPQPEIAKLLAKASYMLYPGAYPETSGISSIESIAHNTPIIGTRFGAMAESGTESASYFIDYAIEPNSLYPWINTDEQVDKFVNLILSVVRNPYLHQQKMYACNAVKDICTWDTIALQWKQHLYSKFSLKLSEQEQKDVSWINYRVHKVFEKRFMNPEELLPIQKPSELTQLIQDKARVCFIDIVGVSYDGSTLVNRGLGGSEAAVILVAKELAELGLDVTVYNACDEEESKPGIYDGVTYKPLSAIGRDDQIYDVVISSRTVNPFVPDYMYDYPQSTHRKIDYSRFKAIREAAKLKVIWMHDTFCWGDDILERLASNNHIDELWTLSDFHHNYVSYCSHPVLRSYEVLRNHLWITRNGMVRFSNQIDFDKKDPNLFVFNSNMSKGLDPLLNHVWPKVKQRLPDARLYVIGGHYKLGNAFGVDNEETEFDKLVNPHRQDPTITFTGILRLEEISAIYSTASYLIYPTAFPETYGISTLEALYHNMTVLSCKFGALEETARPGGYLIPYSVTPNALKGDINVDFQSDRFVDMVVFAYNDKNRKARAKALDEIKDIAGWDTVALEWKQHIYSKLGKYLSRDESQQALYSKYKYQRIFGRRTSTSEQWVSPALNKEQKIAVVSPFYNAQDYIAECILSVAAQTYDNYVHYLIDDCSTDDTLAVALRTIDSLPRSIRSKFKITSNDVNRGAVYNQITTIRNLDDTDIVMLLDGDDKLKNNPDIFTFYNELHQTKDFTYGSCWSIVDNIPLISQPYPNEIRKTKAYKQHKFNWVLPYTHLRTLKAKLLKYEPDKTFMCPAVLEWFKAGGDLATFYAAIEACDPEKVQVVTDLTYMYNDASPLNDYKINSEEQTKTVTMISNTPPARKKKILIGIPTAKYIEVETFKSIYDLIVPDGYEVDFQYFYGYRIDQVRNLISSWVVNGYDYLFSVDSDISFAPDTLLKLLSLDKPIVGGVYRQRNPEQHLEVYDTNYRRMEWSQLAFEIREIGALGFGCVLIKREVFEAIGHPWFEYHVALDHNQTFSEDLDFCKKAREKGFSIWVDSSILCGHHGMTSYQVDTRINIQSRLRELGNMQLLPLNHFKYIANLKTEGLEPKVIYDIGAAVLHWTKPIKQYLWPDAEYVAFDAMDEVDFLYRENGIDKYHLGLLSDSNDKEIKFYQNLVHPGGNSYYRENTQYSPAAEHLFSENHAVVKKTKTLDTVVKERGFPLPDLIKMDVQGAELDILKGATETLRTCKDLILELQVGEYNTGAPMKDEVISYLESIGFVLKTPAFSDTRSIQDDYHFTRL